ncbi:MAG: hypothetical protein ACRDE2_07845 [Chitinophagaceae bacterium]
MEYYQTQKELDIAMWTVDYLSAIDDYGMGIISEKEKEQRQDDIIRKCAEKYGDYTLLISEIFGEL